jgi:hypothetical protein
MAEGQTITINEKEYALDNMNDQQRYFLNQIGSCDQKVASLQFDIDQLQAARQFFVNNLTAALEAPTNVADQLN